MSTDPAAWGEYSFKLLQLRETEHGDCLIASDQAVMLYVRASCGSSVPRGNSHTHSVTHENA